MKATFGAALSWASLVGLGFVYLRYDWFGRFAGDLITVGLLMLAAGGLITISGLKEARREETPLRIPRAPQEPSLAYSIGLIARLPAPAEGSAAFDAARIRIIQELASPMMAIELHPPHPLPSINVKDPPQEESTKDAKPPTLMDMLEKQEQRQSQVRIQ